MEYWLFLPTNFFNMKYLNLSLLIIASYLVVSCGSGKALTSKKTNAETYYLAKDYSNALLEYQAIINIYETNDNSDECPVYTKAGVSAFETGDEKLAISYLKNDEFSNFKTEETFYYLAKSYDKIDNLSLKLMALKDYVDTYPSGQYINEINEQLFFTYVESENYDDALIIWPIVSEVKPNDKKLLSGYFDVNKALKNTEECDVIALDMLEIDPNDVIALEWFGKQYYRKAEDRYQDEMKAYDKKKTNKQYKILLKALDIVTKDFKKSLGYFDKLYTINPKPEYANYLSHIYKRLSDKKKAEYYKKLAK